MNDNQIEEFTKSREQRDEVIELKRALAVALTENHAVKAQLEEQGSHYDENTVSAPGVEETHRKFLEELESTRETRHLEESGIPYSVAAMVTEAIRKGDYATAAKYLDVHQNNETARNLEQIHEADESAKMRSYFGLPPASKKPVEDETAKMRRAFGLR